MRKFLQLLLLLIAASASVDTALAFEQLRIREVLQRSAPQIGMVAESQRIPDGLPDGIISQFNDPGDISEAWYVDPAARYRHRILGDAVEAGGLRIKTSTGQLLTFNLPESEVFEDRYPRLADLDDDGLVEIITIRSSVERGASVTVYGLNQDAIVERASTGFIGRANRWLNIAGIAEFLGTNHKEIAFVKTPHIGGTLFLYSYSGGSIRQVAAMVGFSNHVIGSREMRLSAIADIDQDERIELALPSDDRRSLRVVRFEKTGVSEIARANLPAQIDKAIGVEHSGNNVRFIVGLDSGETYEVFR